MKIIKYTKLKNNKYDIYLDNNDKVSLYDEVILNNDLLLTKEINNINDLIKENEYYDAYYNALKYINRKLRAKKEIIKYLSKTYDNNIIDKVINRLEDEKYINDDIYAASYIHDALILSNKGYYKVLKELNDLGIDNNITLKYLDNINEEEWINKIKKIIDKKNKTNNKYSTNKLKNKITNDLINLGYSKELINSVIDNISTNDIDILRKEYLKVYNKLSKKYQNKDLLFQVTNKLLNSGFNYDDIKEIEKEVL